MAPESPPFQDVEVAGRSTACEIGAMKACLPLALLLVGAAPVDQSTSYLLTLGHIPITDMESIEAFSIQTWGVTFKSVCHIPGGWRIKAGNSATPEGELDGEGSQGATWFSQSSPDELSAFVLVELTGPVQRNDSGPVPATFKGTATINTDKGDVQRPLTYKSITLVPASRCPPAQ